MANKYHQMAAKCKRQDPKYQVLGSFSRDRSIKSKKRGEFALGEFYHLRQHAPRSINCLQVILPVFQVREDQTPVTSLDGGIFCAMSQAFRSASSQNFCFAFNGGQYLHNEGGGAEINTTLSSIKLLFVSNFFFLSTEMYSPCCAKQEKEKSDNLGFSPDSATEGCDLEPVSYLRLILYL